MPAQSTIIGIGEAMLAEISRQVEPTGLALEIALASNRLGQVGIAVSRIGQDMTANELLTKLIAADLNVDHLQSDPDLPTGRLVVRSIAGSTRRSMQTRAAFDNLQWDFDLVDVAQQADCVVFGMLAQRGGQSQSVISRFLDECGPALRVFDLTNRGDEPFDRRQALAMVERSDVLIVDGEAWKQLNYAGRPDKHGDVVDAVMRHSRVAVVIYVKENAAAILHTAEAAHTASWKAQRKAHAIALVAILIGLMEGSDGERCLQLAATALEHWTKKPNEKMPEDWRQSVQ